MIDESLYFIEEAKKLSKHYPRVKYKLHNAAEIPFPCKKAEVIYTRFLLTHLENPLDCIKKWGTQLNQGGVLLIEETESIKTNIPVFQKYIEISEKLLEANKNMLYVGKFLDNLNYGPEFKKKFSEICNVPAAAKDAAELFLLNLPSWRGHEFIKENYSDVEIDNIEEELSGLLNLPEIDENNLFIEWGIRQIVLVKN